MDLLRSSQTSQEMQERIKLHQSRLCKLWRLSVLVVPRLHKDDLVQTRALVWCYNRLRN